MKAKELLIELDVKKTFNFIKKAHTGQQYGTDPYWTHPRKVAAIGRKLFGAKFNLDAVKVAFLHDVVEDTKYTLEQISKMGYSPEVVEAVGLLTKNKALTYKDNIQAIINSGNKLAIMVKYADNYANYTGDKSDWTPEKKASSQKKYKSSMDVLGNKLKVDKHQELELDEGLGDWIEQKMDQLLNPYNNRNYSNRPDAVAGAMKDAPSNIPDDVAEKLVDEFLKKKEYQAELERAAQAQRTTVEKLKPYLMYFVGNFVERWRRIPARDKQQFWKDLALGVVRLLLFILQALAKGKR